MTAEARTKIVDEVKRFAADLNLSESQKSQLQTAYERAEDRIEEIRKANPDVTRADVIKKLVAARDQIREHIVKFLTPDQLKKWDAEMSKARSFLGHPMQA
jgi:predicted HTH transcriptional regulator